MRASPLTLDTTVVGINFDRDAEQGDLPWFPSVLPRSLLPEYGLSDVFSAPRGSEPLLVCCSIWVRLYHEGAPPQAPISISDDLGSGYRCL